MNPLTRFVYLLQLFFLTGFSCWSVEPGQAAEPNRATTSSGLPVPIDVDAYLNPGGEAEATPKGPLFRQSALQVAFIAEPGNIDPEFFIDRLKTELDTLTSRDQRFAISVINSNQDQPFSTEGLKASIEDALNNPMFDIVLLGGPAGNHLIQTHPQPLPKPVLASTLTVADFGAPLVNPEGTSTRKQFLPIVRPAGLREDLLLFHELVPFKIIYILVPDSSAFLKSETETFLKEFNAQIPFEVRLLPAPSDVPGILERIRKKDPQAIAYSGRVGLDPEAFQVLTSGVNDLAIPSLALGGVQQVQEGALAATQATFDTRLARRIALNLYLISEGIDPDNLSVLFAVDNRLVINAATCVAIDFVPTFSVLRSADLLNESALYRGEPLTLQKAAEIAAGQNLERAISAAQTAAQEGFKNISRSRLLPRLSATSQYQIIDRNHARILGQPERLWTAGAQIRQVIFSDALLTDYLSGIDEYRGQRYEEFSVQLDIAALAATRFLNLVLADRLLGVEQLNHRLNRQNLELARVRVTVGAAGPEELLRWESEAATSLASVRVREAEYRRTSAALNQTLGFPGQTQWDPQSIDLAEDEMGFLDNVLLDAVTDYRTLRRLREVTVLLALGNAPELQTLDHLVRSEKRQLGQARRSFFLPEISGQLNYSREIDEDRPTNSRPPGLDRDSWSAVIAAELPLFEGWGRPSEVEALKGTVDSIVARRNQAAQLIEERALSSIYAIEGSWPGVRLSRDAQAKGRKNLDIVQDKYAQGDTGITTLIDAQRVLIRAEANAVLSQITYLTDLIEFQRAICWFEWEQNSRAVQDMSNYLRASITNHPSTP